MTDPVTAAVVTGVVSPIATKMTIETCRQTGANLSAVGDTLRGMGNDLERDIRRSSDPVERTVVAFGGGMAMLGVGVAGAAASAADGAIKGAEKTIRWLFDW